ncbi:MAG TPA: gephyrin-like molybdotransferase receptor GlpR [Pseudonocardiaceae bacterium]|jgi:hypothetical protein|nr:gephyrin-like molybdotransferase receptor GlpR [Pseudonocardiaceae bacterium]
MPSSLIIVALVVAWLLVLVPIVARRRQEVARTADSTLAARVVRSGGVHSTAEEEPIMSDSGEADTELDTEEFEDEYYDDEYADDLDYADDMEYEDTDGYEQTEPRPYRPGRGGFDPEAAAMTARARYTFRQRVVVLMLTAALITGVVGATVAPMAWWLHAAIDIGLVGYLAYLRRQVRIEEEIRERRTARLATAQPPHRAPAPESVIEDDAVDDMDDVVEEPAPEPKLPQRQPLTRYVHPGTVVVDTDDEDPMFAELDDPGALPYRRAVGE